MKQILGIGNTLVDALVKIDNDLIIKELCLSKDGMTLIDTPAYHHIVQRLEGFEVERSTGGSAGNTLLAVACLGGAATFIGKRGRDSNGKFYARERGAQGVQPIALYDDELPTGVATTFVMPDGHRTFATYLGAAATMHAAELREEWFAEAGYFFIEGYLVQNHELIDTAVNLARQAGAKVCLDLASWNIVEADRDFFVHLLKKTDIVFANEEEARAMTGLPAREALEALAQHCPTVVVKLGAQGACAIERGRRAEVPAVSVPEVVDTTGAGDFFAGGFLLRHAQGADLERCLRQGARCAAAVIQVLGTKLPDSVWDELRHEQ